MKSKIFFATVLMWLCLGVIVIMCCFPPWVGITEKDGFGDMTTWGVYHFITESPISDSSLGHLGTRNYKWRINFGLLGIQCVPALGIAALMYYIKVNDKRSRKVNDKRSRIIDKANTMKYGIIAAVLVVLFVSVLHLCFIAPKIFPSLAVYKIYPSSGSKHVWQVSRVADMFTLMWFHIGPPIVFIISILGLVKDKYKYLAVLTMLLVIAWYIFLCWLSYAMREPPY